MIHGAYPARVLRREVARNAPDDAELRRRYALVIEAREARRVSRGPFVVLGGAVYDCETGSSVEPGHDPENVCFCGAPGEATVFVGDEPRQRCERHARGEDFGSPRPEMDHH